MAKRKLAHFDPLFEKLTRRVLSLAAATRVGDGPLIKIPCKNPGQAMNLMMQLRQYWNALEHGVETGEIQPLDPRTDLAAHAGLLACRAAAGNKATVEVIHRSQLTSSLAIASALGELETVLATALAPAGRRPAEPPPPPRDPQEAALAEIYPTTARAPGEAK